MTDNLNRTTLEAIFTKLNDISEKAEYLLQKTEFLVEENNALKEKILQLKRDLDHKETELAETKDQFETFKLAGRIGGIGNEDAEELKRKINKYIKEIDQCLKVLGEAP